jgi:hypothetical protein
VGKTEVVLQVPAVADAVRVCWEGGTADNCGRCEKCLRTATVLALLDRQDLLDRLFVQPLSAHRVRRLRRPDASRPGVLEEVLIRVRDAVAESSDPVRRELFDAWGETTSRSGNGDQAGVWEGKPVPRPEFRAETRRQVIKLMKKRKAEEMI